jgi:hypothetical protein
VSASSGGACTERLCGIARSSTLLALCGTLLLVGCGDGGSRVEPRGGRQIVTLRRVSEAGAQTPQRAVLAWWHWIQAGDADRVLGMMTAAAREPLPGRHSRPAIVERLGPWASYAAPTVLYVERAGPKATVYMRLAINHALAPGVVEPRSERLALPVRRVTGRWRIDDSTWLRVQGRIHDH